LALDEDKVSSPFPERFVVKTSTPQSHEPSIADPRFVFEDYLMAHNRDNFRKCLSSVDIDKVGFTAAVKSIYWSIKKRKAYTDAMGLFYCRLPLKFRQCMRPEQKGIYNPFNKKHYASCKNELSEIEQYFYGTEIFNKPLDIAKIPVDKNELQIPAGFEFENEFKFYDRADYRQTFMNPMGLKSFPVGSKNSAQKLIFYARVPLSYRKCIAKVVILGGQSRAIGYKACNGEIMKDKWIADDKNYSLGLAQLDAVTKNFYEEVILENDLSNLDMSAYDKWYETGKGPKSKDEKKEARRKAKAEKEVKSYFDQYDSERSGRK